MIGYLRTCACISFVLNICFVWLGWRWRPCSPCSRDWAGRWKKQRTVCILICKYVLYSMNDEYRLLMSLTPNYFENNSSKICRFLIRQRDCSSAMIFWHTLICCTKNTASTWDFLLPQEKLERYWMFGFSRSDKFLSLTTCRFFIKIYFSRGIFGTKGFSPGKCRPDHVQKTLAIVHVNAVYFVNSIGKIKEVSMLKNKKAEQESGP